MQALQCYNKALKIDPDNESVLYQKGIVKHYGLQIGGEKDFKKACELGYEKACDELLEIKIAENEIELE